MKTLRLSHTPDAKREVGRTDRGLWVFGLLLLPLSLFGYWFYYVNRASAVPILPTLPLMLSPALAAVISRLALGEGFADVSFKFGGRSVWRAIGIGLAVPLVVGALAYSAAYLSGLVTFAPPTLFQAIRNPLLNVVMLILLNGALGTLLLLPSAAGEEIGWRGYLLLRLIDAGAPYPTLVTSLIWGVWHLVPLLVIGYAAGPYPLLSAVNLLSTALSFGVLLARLRLDTGSIWPSIVAHAAWNAVINGGFSQITPDATAKLWVGESGVLVVLVLILVTLLIGQVTRRQVQRSC